MVKLTCFTIRSFPSITTNTFVGVDAVDTSATIFTGVTLAVINICNVVKEKGGGKKQKEKSQTRSTATRSHLTADYLVLLLFLRLF